MRLATRITVGSVVLVVLMAGLAAYQLTLIQRLYAANRALAQENLEVSRTTLKIRRDTIQLSRLTRVLVVVRDAGYRQELERLRQVVTAAIDGLAERRLSGAEEAELAVLAALWRDYGETAQRTEPRLVSGDPPAGSERSLREALNRIEAQLERLDAASRQAVEDRVADSAVHAGRARLAAQIGTVAALACGLIAAVLISRSVASPLKQLGRGTREMADGNFAFHVPVPGIPELASLAEDFNSMADRLGELDRLKRDFVSAVSHDLKAPLASMEETTRLLLEGPPGPLSDRQERLLRLNLQCCERLAAMIDDLLEVARLESGSVHFELERQDLAGLCRQALEEAQALAGRRRLQVEAELPDDPVPAELDRTSLLRAVWNLLSNAAKFSPPESTIGLRIRTFSSAPALAAAFDRWPRGTRPPAASVEVWDSGPGIPDAEKERIFDRFHRADARHRGEQGTGLGLAIARTIVSGHGGDLWVEDQSAGGSLFVMLLPLRDGTDQPADGSGRHAAAEG